MTTKPEADQIDPALYAEAADYIKRQVRLMEGLQHAALALDKIGAASGAAKEALQARKSAEVERDKALAQLAEARAAVKAAATQATSIVADAKTKAENKAKEILETADVEALRVRLSADTDARQVAGQIAAATAKMNASREEGEQLLEALKAKAKIADQALLTKRAELDKVNTALESLKAKFQG